MVQSFQGAQVIHNTIPERDPGEGSSTNPAFDPDPVIYSEIRRTESDNQGSRGVAYILTEPKSIPIRYPVYHELEEPRDTSETESTLEYKGAPYTTNEDYPRTSSPVPNTGDYMRHDDLHPRNVFNFSESEILSSPDNIRNSPHNEIYSKDKMRYSPYSEGYHNDAYFTMVPLDNANKTTEEIYNRSISHSPQVSLDNTSYDGVHNPYLVLGQNNVVEIKTDSELEVTI